MNYATLAAVVDEMRPVITGAKAGRIFQLSRLQMAIDFRLPGGLYVFIAAEPSSPRFYLIKRRLRELEKSSINQGSFAYFAQKRIAGLSVGDLKLFPDDRIIEIDFKGFDELGAAVEQILIIQLTGRSSNLFLLDSQRRILGRLREIHGRDEQQVGELYLPPEPRADAAAATFLRGEWHSISEALDSHYLGAEAEAARTSRVAAALAEVRRRIEKRKRLLKNLSDDHERHGEAERWKRYGDLLLANAATARRDGDAYLVLDYFDDAVPEIRIEADPSAEPAAAAESYFRRYTKARNAAAEIDRRRAEAIDELDELEKEEKRLLSATDAPDAVNDVAKKSGKTKRRAANSPAATARAFTSSDGFEILVGKKAKDNDYLTFRTAKSLDLWMHAADYPGSHVVVRNPNRQEIPHRTLVEAAKLAAFYSRGKTQVKAAVHYTQRKFVNKPRGAAPGLVSLASFKTILVEPTPPEIARRD